MSTCVAFLLLITCLTLLSISNAQERAPHGLVYESPTAFSPLAYDFFHPKTQNPDSTTDCTASRCSPLPMAAQVILATQAEDSKLPTPPKGEHHIGAGGIAAIVIGLAFVSFLAIGVYYKTNRLRAASCSNGIHVQPDV